MIGGYIIAIMWAVLYTYTYTLLAEWSQYLLFTIRRIPPTRPLRFLGEEIRGEETVKFLGVTLDRRLTWSSLIDQVRRKAIQRLGILSPLLNKRSGLSIRNGFMLYRTHDGLRLSSLKAFCNTFSLNAWLLLLAHLGTVAIYSCLRTWRFRI